MEINLKILPKLIVVVSVMIPVGMWFIVHVAAQFYDPVMQLICIVGMSIALVVWNLAVCIRMAVREKIKSDADREALFAVFD